MASWVWKDFLKWGEWASTLWMVSAERNSCLDVFYLNLLCHFSLSKLGSFIFPNKLEFTLREECLSMELHPTWSRLMKSDSPVSCCFDGRSNYNRLILVIDFWPELQCLFAYIPWHVCFYLHFPLILTIYWSLFHYS